MKDFLHPQIDEAKTYFEGQFPVEQITVAGKSFDYFVIHQTTNFSLPDFPFRMTRKNGGDVTGIFWVSDSVRQPLRPYWPMHEIVELAIPRNGGEGRCANAERIVLEEMPEELRKEFVQSRISFFSDLCDFFEKDFRDRKGNYTAEDLKEAQHSLIYLQTRLPLL